MLPRDLIRFSDTERNTSFAVHIDRTDHYAGVCNFMTPTGAVSWRAGQRFAANRRGKA